MANNYAINEFDNSIINSLDNILNPSYLMVEIGKRYVRFMLDNPNYPKLLMINNENYLMRYIKIIIY